MLFGCICSEHPKRFSSTNPSCFKTFPTPFWGASKNICTLSYLIVFEMLENAHICGACEMRVVLQSSAICFVPPCNVIRESHSNLVLSTNPILIIPNTIHNWFNFERFTLKCLVCMRCGPISPSPLFHRCGCRVGFGHFLFHLDKQINVNDRVLKYGKPTYGH